MTQATLHAGDKEQEQDISALKRAFNRAINKRKWSMIRERIVPRIVPPVMVGAAFTTTLFLNVWEHLPPQARMAGMLAFAGAFMASPLIHRKTGSPVVRREEAIRAIDRDIGDGKDIPARNFSDSLHENAQSEHRPTWDAYKRQIWEKWGDKIIRQKRKTGFGAYYSANKHRAPLHAALLLATAGLAVPYGGNLSDNWKTATDWTVPPPPLVYSVTITPPDQIEGELVYTDAMVRKAMNEGNALQPHESSQLSIVTYDRPATVIVNGQTLEPLPQEAQTVRRDEKAFIYETVLETTTKEIVIDDYRIPVDISPDDAPRVNILGAEPNTNSPTSLELNYSISDDYGATGADATLAIPGANGQSVAPVLDSNKLPQITLPFK